MMPTKTLALTAGVFAALIGASVVATRATHAQTAERVFELRTYTCNEGKLPDLLKRFREHTVEIFKRHGMESIGYWIPQDPEKSKTTLIYIISHSSREAATKNWADFGADPEWKKVNADSNASG